MSKSKMKQWYARPCNYERVWVVDPTCIGECQTDCWTVYLSDADVARIRKHEDEDIAIQRMIEDKIIKVWGTD